ncbi:PE family protein [Mycobacterium uberis]|nr:PE family protein [Mycobacterium uberis]
MSHDPAAGDIGSQLVDIAGQGLASGASALPSLTSLIPAGSEEVSMQAALAFMQDATQLLASNSSAQQELLQAGMALMNISRTYSQVDDTAADTLGFGAIAHAVSNELAGGSGVNTGTGVMRTEALSVARMPLISQFVDNPVIGGTTAPMVANAASSALGTGAAPLSSTGRGRQAGASSKPGLVSSVAQDQDDYDSDETEEEETAYGHTL